MKVNAGDVMKDKQEAKHTLMYFDGSGKVHFGPSRPFGRVRTPTLEMVKKKLTDN